jgi:adenosylcobinamide kinase/adenosylcobinamide-phosphate guanylyltransferase
LRSSLLVLGGARSGKSRFALAAHAPGARVAFVATARAGDADMAARIARHQAERPGGWKTVEEPVDLVPTLERLAGWADAAIVDCLTLWVANRMLRGDDDAALVAAGAEVAAFLEARRLAVTLVSNDVGAGVVPATADGRRFRDLLGTVNQHVAAAADRVVLMVAGLPLAVKGGPSR